MADISLIDDIVITNDGDLKIIYTGDDIEQSAINNLSLRFGELRYHSDIGNKIFSTRLKLSNSSISEITTNCVEAILIDSRIKLINYINVVINSSTSCTVGFRVTTVDGLVITNTKQIILEL